MNAAQATAVPPTIIVLGSETADRIGREALRAMTATIVSVSGYARGEPAAEIADDLLDRFTQRAVPMPSVVAERIAEVLSGVGGNIAIILDDNTVLHGDPDLLGGHPTYGDSGEPDGPFFA